MLFGSFVTYIMFPFQFREFTSVSSTKSLETFGIDCNLHYFLKKQRNIHVEKEFWRRNVNYWFPVYAFGFGNSVWLI